MIWWLELRLITNYYRNPSILQISFLFFAYQLLLILLTLIGGSCSLIPAFSVRKKISERITDGKTLLTMCVKLSLCEIAAKSHLVFTRLSPCSALTSRSARFPSCSARTSLAYPSSFCQAGTRTTAGDSWLCIFQRNKNALPLNTPSPNTHSTSNITASQRTRTIYFFLLAVPVHPPQYYLPLLQICPRMQKVHFQWKVHNTIFHSWNAYWTIYKDKGANVSSTEK